MTRPCTLPTVWPDTEDARVPEVEAWLATLTNTQLVDVDYMIHLQMKERGYVRPDPTAYAAMSAAEKSAVAAQFEAFCKGQKQ